MLPPSLSATDPLVRLNQIFPFLQPKFGRKVSLFHSLDLMETDEDLTSLQNPKQGFSSSLKNAIKIQALSWVLKPSERCFAMDLFGEWAPFPIPSKEWVRVYITAFSWLGTLTEISSSCQSHLFPNRNITLWNFHLPSNSREITLWVQMFLTDVQNKASPSHEKLHLVSSLTPQRHQIRVFTSLLLHFSACHHQPPVKPATALWYLRRKKLWILTYSLQMAP